MLFLSRQDAGKKLGHRLRELGVEADIVAGLPRGGVVVAAEVAEALRCPLDVVVVRKIGHPWHREFAVGAIAEENVLVLDEEHLAANPFADRDLESVIAEEGAQLQRYRLQFHSDQNNRFAGRRILLVDDGLATGATAEAAILSVRKRQARAIILAAPVASAEAVKRLAPMTDQIVTCLTAADFEAVGEYYQQFLPVTDPEVLAMLHRQPADYGQSA